MSAPDEFTPSPTSDDGDEVLPWLDETAEGAVAGATDPPAESPAQALPDTAPAHVSPRGGASSGVRVPDPRSGQRRGRRSERGRDGDNGRPRGNRGGAPLLDRVPPQALEMEQATLGAMLMEREAIVRVLPLLRAEDFYPPQHQLIFGAMVDLHRAGRPVEILLVQERLQDAGKLEAAGGLSYLISLQEGAPTAAVVEYYAQAVREKSIRRSLISTASEVEQLMYESGEEDLGAVLARARELVGNTLDEAAGTSGLQVVEVREFLADESPPPPDIVGTLKAGSVGIIYGPPESAKTHGGIDLARAIVTGREWLGYFPTLKGPALLCDQERSPHLLRERLRDFEAASPLASNAAPLYLLPLQDLRLDTDERRERFRQVALARRPRVIIIDTAISVAGSVNFLDVGQVRQWVGYFRRVAVELEALVFLLCHTPKYAGKEPALSSIYGSEDFGANIDFAFAASCLDRDSQTFRLSCQKNTWDTGRPDLTFKLVSGPGGFGILVARDEHGMGGPRGIVLRATASGELVRAKDLQAAVMEGGYSDRTCRAVVRSLVADHVLREERDPEDKRARLYQRVDGGDGA